MTDEKILSESNTAQNGTNLVTNITNVTAKNILKTSVPLREVSDEFMVKDMGWHETWLR